MKKIIFKSLSNYSVEVVGLIFMIITASVLSNKLTLKDYGLYATISLFMSWLEFVIIGSISRTALIKIGQSQNKLKAGKIMLQAYLVAIFVTIFLLTITVTFWGELFQEVQLKYLLPLISIYIFFSGLQNCFRQISFNLLKTRDIILPNILKHSTKFIFILILTYWQTTFLSCIIAITISSLFPFLYYYYKLGYLLSFSVSKKVIEIFKFSFPIFIATIAMRIFDIADIFCIEYFKGPSKAAIYSPAHSIKLIFSLLTLSSVGFIFPLISKYKKEEDFEKMKNLIYLFFLFGCIGVLFMGKLNQIIQFLITIIYNLKYQSSLQYSYPILLGSFLLSINFSIQSFLYVFDKRKFIMFSSIFVMVFALLSYIFVFYNSLDIVYLTYIYAFICAFFLLLNFAVVLKLVWIRELGFFRFVKIVNVLFWTRFVEILFQLNSFIKSLFSNKKKIKFAIILSNKSKHNFSWWRNLYPHQFKFYTIHDCKNIQSNENIIITSSKQFKILEELKLINNQQVLIPSVEVYNLCMNKSIFIHFFRNTEFEKHFPATENLSFPFVVKKKIEEQKATTYLIHNENDTHQYSEFLQDSTTYFKQEYILGEKEYSFHSVMFNGEICAYYCMEFVFEDILHINYKSKLLYKKRCKIENDKVLFFQKLLNHINYQGISCIDFKIRDGKIYVFEVNPRMGFNLQPYFHTFIENISVNLI